MSDIGQTQCSDCFYLPFSEFESLKPLGKLPAAKELKTEMLDQTSQFKSSEGEPNEKRD